MNLCESFRGEREKIKSLKWSPFSHIGRKFFLYTTDFSKKSEKNTGIGTYTPYNIKTRKNKNYTTLIGHSRTIPTKHKDVDIFSWWKTRYQCPYDGKLYIPFNANYEHKMYSLNVFEWKAIYRCHWWKKNQIILQELQIELKSYVTYINTIGISI